MPQIQDFIEKSSLFYSGKIRTMTEAGAMVVRRMIEEDLPNTKWFPKAVDPYEWLADIMKKSEKTIRGWTCDWSSSSGAKPTIVDFLNLIYITKSQRSIELIKGLLEDASPEELAKNHGNILKKIANDMIELGEKILIISEQ